jgi:hypothetical protein
MIRILLAAISFFAICCPALAEDGVQAGHGMPGMVPQLTHWTLTLLGMGFAARLALQAFGRAVPVEDVPTFPKYMTSQQQYRLGVWAYAIFACGFFLLLVHEHQQVLVLAKPLDIIPESIMTAINDRSAPYLLIITSMGFVYLYLLTQEKPWNVLLMMRDVIQCWISVPQLAKRIMAQIQFSLRVPQHVVSEVIAASDGLVVEQDFRKDINTADRKWAETCYMKWWLTQGLDAGEDATFFTEGSFGFGELIADFGKASLAMRRWKSGLATELATSDIPQTVNDLHKLHKRFSLLVACYLIYRNGSRKELCSEALKFGIKLSDKMSENPLRYWIVYMIALMASVYVGVYASAIGYDLVTHKGLNLGQDPNLALRWVMYSISNYGVAIIVILLLRLLASSLESEASQSHLITYCWTFVVAFLVGPAGLTIAAHVLASGDIPNMPLYALYYDILKWGLGPALVSVYISYYLDRQTFQDLPNIDHSSKTFGWRLLNCFGFASVTLILLLSPLLSIGDQSSAGAAWDTDKVRVVAGGATFCVALGLAIAAQFALRKGVEAPAAARSPQPAL